MSILDLHQGNDGERQWHDKNKAMNVLSTRKVGKKNYKKKITRAHF